MDQTQELSSELVVLVARLVRDVRRQQSDVPAASTRLLSLLDELGPTPVGALAERDGCSQPTMTGLVNGLVERGWAERKPHPSDSRASLVSLTDVGHQTLARVRDHNAELIARRIQAAGRDVEDLEHAVAVLRDLLPTRTHTLEGVQ